MTAAADAGWIAPHNAGLDRRRTVAVMGVAVAAILLWALLGTGWLANAFDDSSRATWRVSVAEDGAVTAPGSGTASQRASTTVRTIGDARFVVSSLPLTKRGSPLLVQVVAGPGIDPTAVSLRVEAPGSKVRISRARDGSPRALVDPSRGSDARVLVVVPSRRAPVPRAGASAGPLRDLTGPLDATIADIRRDHDRLQWLRSSVWFLAPLGLLPPLAALLLWRRAERRFTSMRLPGPGTETTVMPPSSLDPTGAAILIAGARDVDVSAAFAGHVLDLVERRQIRMRRTLDPQYGTGSLLGLAQLEEDDRPGPPEDPAVTLLRSAAVDDRTVVPLPDAASRRIQAPAAARRPWIAHVAARSRFERVVEHADWRRAAAVAALSACGVVAGTVALIAADLPGARATASLVLAVCLPAGVAFGAWALDARRWRRVVRSRRLERAQWLAWAASAGNDGAAASDIRNLPVLVAVGRGDLARSTAGTDAVALAATTVPAVASLRALAGADS